MMPPLDDAFADATFCPICGRESCEDHLPADESPQSAHRDREADPAAAAEAREAHRRILLAQEVERERAKREARRTLDAEERGPIAEPTGYRLRDWLTVPDPDTPWRIAGWQPANSRAVLAAPRKGGKTTFMGSLSRSLLDNDLFLGAATVTPISGSVAILDTEMSPSQLKRWYRDQGIVHDDRLIVFPLKGQAATLDFLDPACRARWATRLRAEDVHYLIVDNLRPILDALGLDESHEAGRWLVGFDALLREAAIPEACLVHHMGHNGERSRGDSRLRDWPDVEWRLMRQDDADSSPRYIAAYGRDVDVAESQLTYDRETRRLTITGGSRKQAKTQNALEAVVEALRRRKKPLSGRGIKDALAGSGHARDTIDAALALGVKTTRLALQEGSRGANLYRVSECPGVSGSPSGHSGPDRVSECPTDSIESDTPDTPVLPLGGNEHTEESPDTRRHRRGATRLSRASGAHNTPRTRRQAAKEP
jgi:hypothetical protein